MVAPGIPCPVATNSRTRAGLTPSSAPLTVNTAGAAAIEHPVGAKTQLAWVELPDPHYLLFRYGDFVVTSEM